LDRKTGKFTHYLPGRRDQDTLGKGVNVDGIYKDAAGYLWAGGAAAVLIGLINVLVISSIIDTTRTIPKA
jgi:hypothetical protein